jgi:hypothetical protein
LELLIGTSKALRQLHALLTHNLHNLAHSHAIAISTRDTRKHHDIIHGEAMLAV